MVLSSDVESLILDILPALFINHFLCARYARKVEGHPRRPYDGCGHFRRLANHYDFVEAGGPAGAR